MHSYRRLTALLCLALAGAVLAAVVLAPAQARRRQRLLIVTVTKGFRHDVIPLGEQVLAELGEKSGSWTADYARTDEDIAAKMTAAGLKQYDAVCFENTTGDLPIPRREDLLDYIRSGHGFIGMHAATDTYHGWADYFDMLGGEFETHHQQCEITGLVVDAKHPANKHLSPTWKITDEIYLIKGLDAAKIHQLVSMDHHPNDGSPDAGQEGLHLVSWCKTYGKGRVFYTILGHRDDVWQNPDYQKHITGGIEWVLGRRKGSARPGQ